MIAGTDHMSKVENTRRIMSNLSITKRLEWPTYLAVIAPIILSLGLAGCGSGHAAIKLTDTGVVVARPLQQSVPIRSDWVATFDGYVNAEIRPQDSGYIIRQNYREGAVVLKGQVLFEIDPRPFQAALD